MDGKCVRLMTMYVVVKLTTKQIKKRNVHMHAHIVYLNTLKGLFDLFQAI